MVPLDEPLQNLVVVHGGNIVASAQQEHPQIFPQPTEAAPRIYTRLFLRTIGVDAEGGSDGGHA